MSRSAPARRLSLESLETRALLAGNVTAAVVDGALTITGDVADNRIYIRQLDPIGATNPWPGARYQISDLYPQGQPVTTVNGQTSVVVEGVKNGITINLGAGNDFVNLSRPGSDHNAATVSGKLVVDMAAGNDGVRLYVVNHREVIVRTGVGGDGVFVTGEVNAVNIATDGLWTNAPGSSDSVMLSNLTVKQKAVVNTGAEGDLFLADRLDLRGPLSLAMEGGNDMARATLETTSSAAIVDIDMGDGNDDVDFGYEYGVHLQQKGEIRIDMGAGEDGLDFRNITSAAAVQLNTGAGQDRVTIHSVTLDSLFLALGDDDDSLTLHEGIFVDTTELDGGAGTDTLTKEGLSIHLGTATVTGFESEIQQ